MGVHSHPYRPYAGPRTAAWKRPLVLTRYALRDALSQKKTIALLVLSAFPLLGAAVIIYLHHNLEAVKILEIPLDSILAIDGLFFFRLLFVQAMAAFLLIVVTGPRVLVADLRDNALPLYLSRPLSRVEYVAGKAAALALLASVVTWVPGLLLFALQATLAGRGWLVEHWRIAGALFLGSWAAIPLFTLICLAIASVVRRKAAAEAAFFSFFFVLPLVGELVDQILDVEWGEHLQFPLILEALWRPLFDVQPELGRMSPSTALLMLAIFLAGAAWVLSRRIHAQEVVR